MFDMKGTDTMLKIGDIIETTRTMSENSPLHGRRLRVKLVTPESVAHGETLIAAGRWKRVNTEDCNER